MQQSEDLATIISEAVDTFRLGKVSQALESFTKALDLAQQQNDPVKIASCNNKIGVCHLQLNQYKLAIDYLQKALELHLLQNNEEEVTREKTYLGLSHFWLGQYTTALVFYEDAGQAYTDKTDSVAYASLRNMMGMARQQMGDYPGALNDLLAALKILQTGGDVSALSTATLNIGMLYISLKNYEQAAEFTSQALELGRQVNNTSTIASALANLGSISSNQEQYQLALDYYQQALALALAHNNKYVEANMMLNIGLAYKHLQQHSLSREHLTLALEQQRRQGSLDGIVKCLLSLSDLEQDSGDLSKALEYAIDSEELARQNENLANLPGCYKHLAKIYERLHRYKKTIDYWKKVLEAEKQLWNQQSQKQLAELQARYEVEQKQKEAEFFRQKAQVLETQNALIEQQKNELSAALDKLRASEIKYETIDTELHRKIGRDLIGQSQAITNIMHLIAIVAQSDSTNVLIIGESGTGKEIVARQIHNLSNRSKHNFFGVNTAAIPESLFESEFFGYEKNAFTNADQQHIGWFEIANQGTLFLDEIGSMPLDHQVKLLRVLEERKIVRLGSHKEIPVSARLVSATNLNLNNQVQKGQFREDLYHRISTFVIQIPPLRERLEDIPVLLKHFVKMFSTQLNKRITRIDPAVITALRQYNFPGNVRELKNLVERAVIVAQSSTLKPGHFLIPGCQQMDIPAAGIVPLHEMEKKAIVRALQATNNHISDAAELLQIERRALSRRMSKYGITKI